MRVLADNVWVDDVFYAKGSVPPPEAAQKVGDHAWMEIEEPTSGPVQEPPVDTSQDGSGITDDDGDDDGEGSEDGDDTPAAPKPVVGTPPPTAGPGSSAKAWLEYAHANGVDVVDDAKRDDVIQALTLAGLPVE